jgi:CrcB protein
MSTVALAAVACGAAVGAVLRWLLGETLNGYTPSLPAGTLVANVVGGLLAGVAMAWLARHPEISPAWRLFLTTGFLGGLTTFSTFSAESLSLILRGDLMFALAHSALHLVGSLAAAALGYRLLTWLS